MPRGRIILRTLGTWSDKFEALGKEAGRLSEFAQALYPMLVTNADDFGRLDGGARAVKYAIWSRSPRCVEEFDQALFAMDQVGLIRRAEVEGRWVIQIENFDSPQSGLHKRTASKFPEVPGNSPLREGKGREGKRREERTGADAPTAPESETQDWFSEFWSLYPRKVAKAKARKAWFALNPDVGLQATILAAVVQHAKMPQWVKDGGQFIPHPATWLHQRRWEDELGVRAEARASLHWYDDCHHEPRCERLSDHRLQLAKEAA